MDKLTSLGVITPFDETKIRNTIGFHDMARELIYIIRRKSDDAYEALIKALNETEQNHVAFILSGRRDSRPLSVCYRQSLKDKRADVVRSIIPGDLMSTLISKGVFTSHDQQRVEARITDDEKVEMMLDLIARKSQAAFDGFIDTLQECNHVHVAHELMGIEVAAKIEAKVKSGKHVMKLKAEIRKNMQQSFEHDATDVKHLTKVLASNGISVSKVLPDSIIVKFRCRDYDVALESFEKLHRSGELDELFTDAFCPKFADKGLKFISVSIPEYEFQRCRDLKLTLSERHRKALLSSELVDTVTVSDGLLSKLSLSQRRRQAIERAATREQQVKTLLDTVSRQSVSAFAQFCRALNDTQQTTAASSLMSSCHGTY